MGMWATAPWDNDQAADWYAEVMEKTQLRARWLEGIQADPEDEPEVVRAAAALFVMLGRVYVWPVANLDADLELAIAALTKVATADEYQASPELVGQINAELDELKRRRRPGQGATTTNAAAPSPSKPWWRFW